MKTTKTLFTTVLTLCLYFCSSTIEAQWSKSMSNVYLTTPADIVGIGTTTPSYKFHVNSTINGWTSVVQNQGTIVYSAYGNGSSDGYGMHIRLNNSRSDRYAFQIYDGTNYLMHIANDGKVGIGLSTPTQKLEVAGTIKAGSALVGDGPFGAAYSCFRNSSCNAIGNYCLMQSNIGATYLNSASGQDLLLRINNETKLIVKSNGNIGIGTNDPSSKLTVKGEILCSKVRVVDIAIIPDYVFEPDYNLIKIEEVENFIVKNKHLPEIPAASEIQENGMDMGEMNKLLLKKIEEQTLYIIQLNNRLKELEEKVNNLN